MILDCESRSGSTTLNGEFLLICFSMYFDMLFAAIVCLETEQWPKIRLTAVIDEVDYTAIVVMFLHCEGSFQARVREEVLQETG